MHLDTDAYLALGGMVSILVITIGLGLFIVIRRR